MKKLTTTIILLIFAQFLHAQIDTTTHFDDFESEIIDNLEQFLEENDEEVDYSDELSELLANKGQKIDLNALSVEMAMSILQLTDYQYYQLQLYIEQYGALVSVYELFAVEGFSADDVQKLLPYVEVKPPNRRERPFRNFFRSARQELLLRYGQILERQAGYDETRASHYLGSPPRLMFRYTFSSQDHFSFGLSGEKDAGEALFKPPQRAGFDFYSMHVAVKNIGVLRTAVLGDYKLNLGQGLVVGAGLLGGKGSGVGNIRKFYTGVRPTTAMNEGVFFRGAAVEVGNARYNGIIFYSHRFYDGKIFYAEEDDARFFDGSLTFNGFHRTEGEVEKKNALLNRVYGVNFQMNRRIFRLGLRAVKTDFSASVVPKDLLYKKYAFSGSGNCNFSADYQLIIKKSVLFGEYALSRNFAPAILQGVIFELDPRAKFVALFRYYDKRYQALNSAAFGENSPNQNEIGGYIAGNFVLGKRTELFIYGDFYAFPWLKFSVDKPSIGYDLSAQLSIDISRNTKLIARYRYRCKEQNLKTEQNFLQIQPFHKHKFKLSMTTTSVANLKLKTEFNLVYNSSQLADYQKVGYLFFQDISYTLPRIGLQFVGRFALFDTDSFEERISAYEQDLLFSFSSNTYFYQGVRGYLMIKYGYRFFDFWIRLSRTFYANRVENGSGLDLISSAGKTELKCQLFFKF